MILGLIVLAGLISLLPIGSGRVKDAEDTGTSTWPGRRYPAAPHTADSPCAKSTTP